MFWSSDILTGSQTDAMDELCRELRNEGEYLIFEGYLDPALYESQLFTEDGEYYGTEA